MIIIFVFEGVLKFVKNVEQGKTKIAWIWMTYVTLYYGLWTPDVHSKLLKNAFPFQNWITWRNATLQIELSDFDDSSESFCFAITGHWSPDTQIRKIIFAFCWIEVGISIHCMFCRPLVMRHTIVGIWYVTCI